MVQQIVALFGERPTANAFGIAVWAIATRGLGRLAWTQSRSMIACSSGACCGETSRAPIEYSAILSEVNSCTPNSSAAISAIVIAPAPAAIRTPIRSA